MSDISDSPKPVTDHSSEKHQQDRIIKICGIKDSKMAQIAAAEGATHIGLVFHPASPRYVSMVQACDIAIDVRKDSACQTRPKIVALVVDKDVDQLDRLARDLAPDVIQFHGSETAEDMHAARAVLPGGVELWKAIGVSTSDDVCRAFQTYDKAADRILFDAKPPEGAAYPGGHGHAFAWRCLQDSDGSIPWLLAGGLSPETVGDAITQTQDYRGFCGVDVSSRIESAPGQKDPALLSLFIAQARSAMHR